MIEVKNITKTYGRKNNKFRALSNVSFSVPDGAIVAIVGKSGSGKSTLIHAMSGLDAPERGEVIVDGANILSMKRKNIDRFRSREMGFIFQSFFVQPMESCYENVSLPLEIAEVPFIRRANRIKQALEKVGLSNKIKTRARDLSGGEKQRLAIARAIVNEPKIIFADEPTGNLDTATSATIEKMLFEYSKKYSSTLFIVTHDEDLANKCDIKITISDGKIFSIEGEKDA